MEARAMKRQVYASTYSSAVAPNGSDLHFPADSELSDPLSPTRLSEALVDKGKHLQPNVHALQQLSTRQLTLRHQTFLAAVVEQPVQQWSDLFNIEDTHTVATALMLADVLSAQVLRLQAYAIDKADCQLRCAEVQQLLLDALTSGGSIVKALITCKKILSSIEINRLQVKPRVAVALKNGLTIDSFLQLLDQQGVEIVLQSAVGLYLQEKNPSLNKTALIACQYKLFAKLIGLRQHKLMLNDVSQYHMLFEEWPMDVILLGNSLASSKQKAQAEFDIALHHGGLTKATVAAEFARAPKLNRPMHVNHAMVACTAANAVHAMLV